MPVTAESTSTMSLSALRQACGEPRFFSEEDDCSDLHWLDEALRATDCQLHAYALLTNHTHLLVTSKKADAILKLIMSLGGARFLNKIERITVSDVRRSPMVGHG